MVVDMTAPEQDSEYIRAHLSMMQSGITRMAENSRACKTWALTLVAAMLVAITQFGVSTAGGSFGLREMWIAVVPATIFWVLDAYYLALEKGFIESYNNFVRKFRSGKLSRDELFEIKEEDAGRRHFRHSLFSISTLPFYSMLGVGIFVAWWVY